MIMKRISLILAVCMILTSFGTVGLVSAADAGQDSDVSTVMLDAEDFVKNINFISGDRNTNTSASTTLFMDKNISQMADITAEYKQPAFMKFDISDYVTEGSNIVGAELLWRAMHKATYVLLDVPATILPWNTAMTVRRRRICQSVYRQPTDTFLKPDLPTIPFAMTESRQTGILNGI